MKVCLICVTAIVKKCSITRSFWNKISNAVIIIYQRTSDHLSKMLSFYLKKGFLSIYWFRIIRHFSHLTKSRIFKNLNSRKKADRNFHRTFLKNRFRHLELYSIPLIGQKLLSYGHLLKDERLKFTFLREPTLQVLVRGISPPKKT